MSADSGNEQSGSLWEFLREDVPQPRFLVYAVNIAVVVWTFGGIYALVEWLG